MRREKKKIEEKVSWKKNTEKELGKKKINIEENIKWEINKNEDPTKREETITIKKMFLLINNVNKNF